MRKLMLATASALAMAGGLAVGSAQAAPVQNGLQGVQQNSPITTVDYYFAGRRYCFYPSGWRGPGFYWCGYEWRRGYGWGGPFGWHGWRVGGYERYGHGRSEHRGRHFAHGHARHFGHIQGMAHGPVDHGPGGRGMMPHGPAGGPHGPGPGGGPHKPGPGGPGGPGGGGPGGKH
ncbi:MAG TPA: hypothetical protein VND97_07690 [Beijerinckiaceae bacterium]|nr:hypothetical protein [Beijerinckiaceae bacterium]